MNILYIYQIKIQCYYYLISGIKNNIKNNLILIQNPITILLKLIKYNIMEENIEKKIVNINEEKNINKDRLGLKEIKHFNSKII